MVMASIVFTIKQFILLRLIFQADICYKICIVIQTLSRRTFIFLSPRYIPTNKDSKIYDFLLFYNTEPFRAIITNSHESLSEKYPLGRDLGWAPVKRM